MKKGFTLIELLGVIVILSVIMVIIMPNIVNSIKKASKDNDVYTSNIIYKAVDNYISHNNKYRKESGNTYCIAINTLVNEGLIESPVRYNDNDNIENTMSVKIKYNTKWNYSIVKNSECISSNIVICEKTNFNNVTTGFVPNNNYRVGDEYICDVNNSNSYHFFILGVNGDKVSLIADRNLQDNGTLTSSATNANGWYTVDDNSYGPVTAYTYLNTNTNSWTNIPTIKKFNFTDINRINSYGYVGISIKYDLENYITNIYPSTGSKITYNNMKARLPIYDELVNVGCSETTSSCQSWLTGYLDSNTDNCYWLMDSAINTSNSGMTVTYNTNQISYSNASSTTCGIRPVIELYKSNLE